MDVADEFLADPSRYRRRACGCGSFPEPPRTGAGCRCPVCGADCRLCGGFGVLAPSAVRVHRILSRVRSQLRRRTRLTGRPPGFVRLAPTEVRALLGKREAEETGHWIRDYVEPGPPLRVFDVIIVVDGRKG